MNTTELREKRKDNYILAPVDIYENEAEYLVKIAMPGVSSASIDISMEKDYLEIEGKVENELEEYKLIDAEYKIKDYFRRLYIGNKIDRDKVSAKAENGILNLTLPKSEDIRPRKIEITGE
jgi:HSP20 family protein